MISMVDNSELSMSDIKRYSDDEFYASAKKLFGKSSRVLNDNNILIGVDQIIRGKDYRRHSIKRSRIVGIGFIDCDLGRAAFTGSIFENVQFRNCRLYATSFQSCTFKNCRFIQNGLMRGNNFTDCEFDRTEFNNSEMRSSNFYNSKLRSCTLKSVRFESTDFEGTKVIDCTFEEVSLNNPDVEFATFINPKFRRSSISAYQCTYALGALNSIIDDDQDIKFELNNKEIDTNAFLHVIDDFIVYYTNKGEFYPLVNICALNGDMDRARSHSIEGVKKASATGDLRMVEHFCKQASFYGLYDPGDAKSLYNHISGALCNENDWSDPSIASTLAKVRSILFEEKGCKSKMEITIGTNITSYDDREIMDMIEYFDRISAENGCEKDIRYTEIRRNSPIFIDGIDMGDIGALITTAWFFLEYVYPRANLCVQKIIQKWYEQHPRDNTPALNTAAKNCAGKVIEITIKITDQSGRIERFSTNMADESKGTK